MDIKLKRYKKNFDHSYTFGAFPTLELLTHRSDQVLKVLIHPKGSENQGSAKIEAICQSKGIPTEFQEKVFQRLGARENDYAVGVYRKTHPSLDQSTNHVVLVNPGSMGNLGTIMRTMLGFGFQDLAIIEPAADHFDPKVVRASMGATFKLRISTFQDFEHYRQRHTRQFYSLMTDATSTINSVLFKSPFSLIFGNESSGLGEEYHEVGTSIRIPQKDEIDSFNVAIAVGITLYQVSLALKS